MGHSVYAIARPSVFTRVNHTKTVEVRIMKFSPYGSPISLVFLRGKFHLEILAGSPRARRHWEGWETQAIF